MMKCLLVDDEPVAREILRTYITDLPTLELAGECEDAMQALEFLQQHSVDLILLDINMPKLSGIGFLKSLQNPPPVILTTAYSEYALESYELDVVDYLLKPFSFERFLKAIQKVSHKDSTQTAPALIIKTDGRTFRIPHSDILFIESAGDYVIIHTKDENFTVYKRLKVYQEQLPDSQFIRIHKSYIISLSAVEFLEGNQVSIGEKLLPIGKTFKPDFFARFEGN